jgi:hypothetical protein
MVELVEGMHMVFVSAHITFVHSHHGRLAREKLIYKSHYSMQHDLTCLYQQGLTWPEFDKRELLRAMEQYGARRRRYGK